MIYCCDVRVACLRKFMKRQRVTIKELCSKDLHKLQSLLSYLTLPCFSFLTVSYLLYLTSLYLTYLTLISLNSLSLLTIPYLSSSYFTLPYFTVPYLRALQIVSSLTDGIKCKQYGREESIWKVKQKLRVGLWSSMYQLTQCTPAVENFLPKDMGAISEALFGNWNENNGGRSSLCLGTGGQVVSAPDNQPRATEFKSGQGRTSFQDFWSTCKLSCIMSTSIVQCRSVEGKDRICALTCWSSKTKSARYNARGHLSGVVTWRNCCSYFFSVVVIVISYFCNPDV